MDQLREQSVHYQLQYELAMAIGSSLDLRQMLHDALSAIVDKLKCASGSIYLCAPDRSSVALAHAIPNNPAENRSCQTFDQQFSPTSSGIELESLCHRLPLYGSHADIFSYMLAIPNFGCLVMTKEDEPLEVWVLEALPPLLEKLGHACQACRQNEELAQLHRQTTFEHNMMRTLLDNVPLLVFALDPKGVFLAAEGRGIGAAGRPLEELIGRSCFDLYQGQTEILDAVSRALAGQVVSATIEQRGHSLTGHLEPVFDQTGAVSSVVGMAYDVTERKSATDMLSSVLSTMDEGIITIDTDGSIIMVNHMTEGIFGYHQEELIGQNLKLLMPFQYHESHDEGMNHYRATGIGRILNQRFEVEGRHKSGRIFPMDLRISETQIRGKTYFVGSVRDVTHRKDYDRLREGFVSTVSHELRTPLASIMGWTETLLNESAGPLTPPQRRFLGIIYQNSERLNKLIEDTLVVADIQGGAVKLTRQPFFPSALLAEAISDEQEQADRRAIRVELDDQWPSSQVVFGDAARLAQVLSNLIDNAIKFSHDGAEVRIHSFSQDGCWALEIENQGVGVPGEELPSLFQRFYRASTAIDAQIQGAGLGLYISKAIVDAHNGAIKLEKIGDIGTRVRLTIPAR